MNTKNGIEISMRTFSATTDKRGAALILEIIIYLVIVALIAVAVTSGVQAIKNLAFANHAKADIQQVHEYMESQRVLDGDYTIIRYDNNGSQTTLNLTQVGWQKNVTKVNTRVGTSPGYCIAVTSATISGEKKLFWSSSDQPQRIMQRGTKSADSLGSGPFDSLCYLPVDTGIGEG